MSFMATNPILVPKVTSSPSVPIKGTRGIFAKEDGWYDIDDDGVVSKLGSDPNSIIAIQEQIDGIGMEIERVEGELCQQINDAKSVASDNQMRITDVESQIGDIDSALDELHNYAQSLVGGGA